MDISKSADPTSEWVGGAALFSGRPDPTWFVSKPSADQLVALWETLRPSTTQPPPAPALGYRGCFLRDTTQQREWTAYQGIVAMTSAAGSEARQDPDRAFERALLASAPEGLLPAAFIAIA